MKKIKVMAQISESEPLSFMKLKAFLKTIGI